MGPGEVGDNEGEPRLLCSDGFIATDRGRVEEDASVLDLDS
jgi:hypothetical protein